MLSYYVFTIVTIVMATVTLAGAALGFARKQWLWANGCAILSSLWALFAIALITFRPLAAS